MRKLTVLVTLLTGLSMAGAVLLAGIVGQREEPPRVEPSWQMVPEAAPAITTAAEAAEVGTSPGPMAEGEASRRQLDTGPQPTDESEGPVLLVVDKASGLPVPGAEVAYVEYGAARARHREEKGPPYAHRSELAERYGPVLVTGSQGTVRLPEVGGRTLVAVNHGDKYAETTLQGEQREDVVVQLEADETLVLKVIDSNGTGREEVPLGVYRGEGEDKARLLWGGTSSTDGLVTLRHFQLLRQKPGSGDRFAAALRIPLGKPSATEFPAAPLPGEPVTVTLPLTGRLRIDLVDMDGNEVLAGGRMTLQASRPEEKPVDLPLDRSVGTLSAMAEAGESSFVFPFVGLDLELQPSCRLNGVGHPWKPEPVLGPTAPDEIAQSRIVLPGDMTLLSGVLLGCDGEALTEPWFDFQLDAAESQIGRSRAGLTDGGRFEMAVRLDEASPPFTLQIQTRRQPGQTVTGLRVELRNLRNGQGNDLGTLHLAELQVFAHGTVMDDLGDPVANAWVNLQRYQTLPNNRRRGRRQAAPGTEGQPQADWHNESLVRAKTDEQGRFELLGEPLPGRLRLGAHRSGYMNAISPEITPGEEIELRLSRAGALRGEFAVPSWLPGRAVLVRLTPRENEMATNRALLRARDGKGSYRFSQLPIGVYDLAVELRGFPDPVFEVYGLPIVAGENGENPQLQDLDLTGCFHRIILRAQGTDGSTPEEGTIVARFARASGEAGSGAFPLRGGRAELVTPELSLELTVLANGYLPQQLTPLEGERAVYLERAPTALLVISGLRALLGPESKVKIVLRNTRPADLPETLRGIDPTSGRGYSVDRGELGGGSGWLGADDTVSVALGSSGEYEVSLQLQEKGARPVSLGAVRVELGQGGAIAVPLDRERVAQELGNR